MLWFCSATNQCLAGWHQPTNYITGSAAHFPYFELRLRDARGEQTHSHQRSRLVLRGSTVVQHLVSLWSVSWQGILCLSCCVQGACVSYRWFCSCSDLRQIVVVYFWRYITVAGTRLGMTTVSTCSSARSSMASGCGTEEHHICNKSAFGRYSY